MKTQTGNISIRRDSWFFRWYESATVDGRQVSKPCSKVLRAVTSEDRKNRDRKTRQPRIPADVQAQMDDILNVVNGPQRDSYGLTIGELVENRFFPDMEQAWKPSSLYSYRCLWDKYLKPRIGSIAVRQFERKDAHRLWQTIHMQNPHLRKRSMGQIKSVVNSVFKWALDRGLYHGDNPAKASLPHGMPENKETHAYSIEEIRAILAASIDPKLSALVALFFGSGLRRGEVAGLEWSHYDRRDNGAVLHIRQAAWNGKLQSPKTKQSIGDIDLGEAFCSYIDAYRASLPKGSDSGLMFAGRFLGRPMNLDTWAGRNLFPVLKAAGVPWYGWHGFRRGNSTFVARSLGSESAAALSRHTVEIAEANYIKQSEQERRGSRAAKVISMADKLKEQRKTAADTLSKGMIQ